MILITVGSQKFQFNRLLKWIDQLIEENLIDGDTVFAQTGFSDYIPKNYSFTDFLERENLIDLYNSCDLVITHAGTGAIVNGLKKNKKIIVVPRNPEFNEHVDDHQYEIAKKFHAANYCLLVETYDSLKKQICLLENSDVQCFKSNTQKFLDGINKLIEI